MTENKKLQGHLLALITIIVWGTTFISTKILLRDFSPLTILVLRFVIGILALCLLYPKRLKNKDRKLELMFALAGLCGVTLYFLFENIALTYSLASNVGVIISVAPMFTSILASRFLHEEKIGKNFVLGFLIAITGIACISLRGSELKLNPLGDILTILAALVWAAYSIITKRIGEYGYHTMQTTRRIFFYGLVFMLPALFFLPFQMEASKLLSPVNLCNILYLGIGASALCFVSWNYAMKILGAVKTSVYIYLGPVITVVTSVLILGERITWISGLGTVLTLAGLIISEHSPKASRENKQPYRECDAADEV